MKRGLQRTGGKSNRQLPADTSNGQCLLSFGSSVCDVLEHYVMPLEKAGRAITGYYIMHVQQQEKPTVRWLMLLEACSQNHSCRSVRKEDLDLKCSRVIVCPAFARCLMLGWAHDLEYSCHDAVGQYVIVFRDYIPYYALNCLVHKASPLKNTHSRKCTHRRRLISSASSATDHQSYPLNARLLNSLAFVHIHNSNIHAHLPQQHLSASGFR